MTPREDLARDVVILACAVSAGIHGALAPAHLDGSAGAGAGFVAATVALAVVSAALTLCPASLLPLLVAAALLGGLLVSYGLATTTGLPVLHPDPEPVDALAVATKAIELAGLLAAASILGGRLSASSTLSRPEGTLS